MWQGTSETTIVVAILTLVVAALAAFLAFPPYARARSGAAVDHFRATRRLLVSQRSELARKAAKSFPDAAFIVNSDYITHADWIPNRPVPLDDVAITLSFAPKTPPVSGECSEARRLLPPSLVDEGESTYARVIEADDSLRPALFWNGPSYDLISVECSDQGVEIDLTTTSYFEMFSVSEALAHEFACGRQEEARSLRRAVGEPTDLARRPALPALAWLLVLKDTKGELTFFLHERDVSAVASDGGVLQVYGGQLQPSSRHALAFAEEASLWHTFCREFAEEILGAADAAGDLGGSLDYGSGVYADLRDLHSSGLLKVWFIGMGLDPLSLWPTILCMAIVHSEAFGELLPEYSERNSEGRIIGNTMLKGSLQGYPFREDAIANICQGPNVGAATVACLQLAWEHRAWFDIEEA